MYNLSASRKKFEIWEQRAKGKYSIFSLKFNPIPGVSVLKIYEKERGFQRGVFDLNNVSNSSWIKLKKATFWSLCLLRSDIHDRFWRSVGWGSIFEFLNGKLSFVGSNLKKAMRKNSFISFEHTAHPTCNYRWAITENSESSLRR